MTAILKSFKQLVIQLKTDMMLTVVIISPIIIGAIFHFALPIAEYELCNYFETTEVLLPYYLIFDLLLILLTPMMISFCVIMVMLEEIDDGIAEYLMVTPLDKKGYLISRIGLPTIFAFIYNIVIVMIFSLTKIPFIMIITLSLLSGIMSIITSLLVVSIASNKVEGMAMAKLSGLIMIGLPVPFFTSETIQYITFMLPSLWFAKLAITQNYLFAIPTIIISLLWIWILLNKFEKKLAKGSK